MRAELVGIGLSAAIVLPVAYGAVGVPLAAGAILLGTAELVHQVVEKLLKTVLPRLHPQLPPLLGYVTRFAGGFFLANYAIEALGYAQLAVLPAIPMILAAALVVKFVRDKLGPVPPLRLAKDILENLVLRPANATVWAVAMTYFFTTVPLMTAAVMAGTIFLGARVCMFVADKLIRTQWDHELRRTEQNWHEAWSWVAMGVGAVGGWQLGLLGLGYLGLASVGLPVMAGVGVGTMIGALASWRGISVASELGFRHFGWEPLPHAPRQSFLEYRVAGEDFDNEV